MTFAGFLLSQLVFLRKCHCIIVMGQIHLQMIIGCNVFRCFAFLFNSFHTSNKFIIQWNWIKIIVYIHGIIEWAKNDTNSAATMKTDIVKFY